MKYDFTTVWQRKGMDCRVIDMVGKYTSTGGPGMPKEGFDIIPMWIADMNFATAPSVIQAITDRLQHPLFGYFDFRNEYYESIIQWHRERYHVEGMTQNNISYINGVHGGNLNALKTFCSVGSPVLIHTPAYSSFLLNLQRGGYKTVASPLVQDEDNVWRMDFDDMEKKIRDNKIHIAVFCSPHNPTGRVWERWELEAALEIFKKYDVTVISDEIWFDLAFPGYQHIPTQSINEDARNRVIATYAPSKTFNLAGFVGGYTVIYNQTLRDKFLQEMSLSHLNNNNLMAMYSLIGAYKPEGGEWVDELRQVLAANAQYACDFIEENFEGVTFSRPQGTYMLFLNCAEWLKAHNKSLDELLHAGYDVGVVWQDGRAFAGPTHIRMNLALPTVRVQEAFARLKKYVFCV